MCADMQAWVDSESRGCDHYHKKCKDGFPMRPHREFMDFAVHGVSALDACCGCGGGVGGDKCHDNHLWKDIDGYSCADYDTTWCQAGAALHPWIEFASLAAEPKPHHIGVSALDACCACGGGIGEERCENRADWKDKNGADCDSYRETCKFGTPLHGIADYENNADENGVNALHACCICGGGSGGPRCKDVHEGDKAWEDAEGYGCHDYEAACDGRHTGDADEFVQYAATEGPFKGVSAIKGCCRCGGGTIEREGTHHGTHAPSAPR